MRRPSNPTRNGFPTQTRQTCAPIVPRSRLESTDAVQLARAGGAILVALTALLSLPGAAFAQDDIVGDGAPPEERAASPYAPPKSADDSLRSMEVVDGFRVELVASEPLVVDPVSIAWGADGKLWVVEMGGYPVSEKGGGRIKYLQDEDGDGRFDKATVFLSGLAYPGSVLPWGRVVLVACAPEIFYAEDVNGDGRADTRRTILAGFVQSNPQHQVNGLSWGLDNWVHAANGDSGGVISFKAAEAPLDIHARDFRFRPGSGEMELESGMSQFTRFRDDFGNWFGGNSSWPLWHDVIPDRYLLRNPHWAPPEPCVYVTDPAANPPVYPRSEEQRRLNEFGRFNRLTSACGGCSYRDVLFGPQYLRSVFICEPAHNLVHHETLSHRGVTFRGQRLDDQQEREFLTSTDNWFRPTQAITGPDGALWVVDMYRLIIEHPDFFDRPPELLNSADIVSDNAASRTLLRAGDDRGRIYRVAPIGKRLRRASNLARASTPELLTALGKRNGTSRDTAHRLLLERAAASPSLSAQAKPNLEDLARHSQHASVRVQAISVLSGLSELSDEVLLDGLRDSDSAVLRFAIRTAEARLGSDPVLTAVLGLSKHPDVRIRLQVALSLGESEDPRIGAVLAEIALTDIDKPHVVAAVVSSSARHTAAIVRQTIRGAKPSRSSSDLIANLLRSSLRHEQPDVLAAGLGELSKGAEARLAWRCQTLGRFLDALDDTTLSLAALHQQADPDLVSSIDSLAQLFATARQRASDPESPMQVRLAAMPLLGRGLSRQDDDARLLSQLLAPTGPLQIQLQAVESLSRLHRAETVDWLLKDWPLRGPRVREAILEALLSRRQWTLALVKAIDAKQVAASRLSLPQRERLLLHYFSDVRELAARVLKRDAKAANLDVLKMHEAIAKREGDENRGAQLFVKHCLNCHAATPVKRAGPPLTSLREQPSLQLLTSVMKPSQAVAPAFVAYTAVFNGGRIINGVVVSEAGASIRMVSADGKQHVILRADLETLQASPLSLMPEGFDQVLPSPQDLADLIALIQSGKANDLIDAAAAQ